jgi:hypothetical protein
LRDKILGVFLTAIGRQNESIEKTEPEPGFENTQDLSKKLIISMESLKF